MNIPLPTKKKRRMLLPIIFLSTLLLTFSGVTWIYFGTKNTPNILVTDNSIATNSGPISKDKFSSNKKERINEAQKEETITPISSADKIVNNSEVSNYEKDGFPTSKMKDSKSSTESNSIQQSTGELIIITENLAKKSNVYKQVADVTPTNLFIQPKQKNYSIQPVFTLTQTSTTSTNIDQPQINTILTVQENIDLQTIPRIAVTHLPSSIFPLEKLDLHTKSLKSPEPKVKKYALLLSAGYNKTYGKFGSDIQTDTLTKTEKSAWGNSFQLSLEYKLKKHYFASVGIANHKLHTTFEYRKELDTYIDFTLAQKIKRSRYIFKNNYFNYLQLKVGAGKNIPMGKYLSSQIIVHLNPSYKTRHTGRALDENESIVDIEDHSSNKKWFLSASINLRLSYQFNNTHIFTGVEFNQAISKVKVFDNSNTTLQPQSTSLSIGVKRDF